MANIAINCPHCQYALLIDELDANQRIICPGCGQVLVTVAEEPALEHPKLALRPQPSEAKRCPACQQEVAAGTVLCVNCGTNLLTGQNLIQASDSPAFAPPPPPPRNIGRVVFPIAVVLALLLGGLWWLHRKPPAENQAPAQATPAAGIETAYHTLTAHPPRADADFVKTIRGIKALAAQAAALGLPEWQTRCAAAAAQMEARRTALNREFHSLSNAVSALAAKHDFRAAAQLLQTYHGAFAVETAPYRAAQAAVLERQAAPVGAQPSPPPALAATNTPPRLPTKEEEALNQEFLAAIYQGEIPQFRVLLARDAQLSSTHHLDYADAVLAIARSEEGWSKAVLLAQALNNLGAAEGTYSNLVSGLNAIHDRELQRAVIINRCAHMKAEAAQELRAVAVPATAGGPDFVRTRAAAKLEAAKHKLEEADKLRQDAAAMPGIAAQLQELRDVLHGTVKSKPTDAAAPAHPAAPAAPAPAA